ncbi:MAG TPA: hypothetical protein VJU83_12370 [Burkholderiales bacterium]|nr:hypothetical protein [Burkholderiales bacterium]
MKIRNIVLLPLLPFAAVACVATPVSDYPVHRTEVGVEHRGYPGPQYYPATGDYAVDARQRQQQNSIAAGVRSGELTKKEAEILRVEQRQIAQEEAAYKRDGRLTSRERAELQRELDEAERHIRGEKNDRQDRN